mgnify:CR=1 FL=1
MCGPSLFIGSRKFEMLVGRLSSGVEAFLVDSGSLALVAMVVGRTGLGSSSPSSSLSPAALVVSLTDCELAGAAEVLLEVLLIGANVLVEVVLAGLVVVVGLGVVVEVVLVDADSF